MKERQKTWVGHVLMSGNLLQRVIEGRIQGKPTRGRKRIATKEEHKIEISRETR